MPRLPRIFLQYIGQGKPFAVAGPYSGFVLWEFLLLSKLRLAGLHKC